MKLSKKQKEIIKLMREGHPLIIGVSDTTGRNYYLIASTHNNGFGNTYFNATVFKNLLYKDLIFQEFRHPHDYVLTSKGWAVEL